MLKDLAIKQFSEIYKAEFGITLTKDEAQQKALRVFTFYKTIINEISKDKKVSNFNKKGGCKEWEQK